MGPLAVEFSQISLVRRVMAEGMSAGASYHDVSYRVKNTIFTGISRFLLL